MSFCYFCKNFMHSLFYDKHLKTYSFAAIMTVAAVASAGAAPLTPQQALTRVTESAGPGMQRAAGPAYTLAYAMKAADAQTDAFFVFNSEDGFIIASADDRLVPCLAYGSGQIADMSELPDNAAAWLNGYADEINYYLTRNPQALEPAAVFRAAGERQPVTPLCTTRWNQKAPYNSSTPTFYGSNAVTGCVATAMAQIMKHYSYPEHGTGSYSYTWNNVNVSSDFSSATYEWDKMFDLYDPITSAEESRPIGLIMAHCGTAVHMQYGVSLSGAFDAMIPYALTKYFGYDPDVSMIYRDAYSNEEWEEIIYREISQGRPVQYAGCNNNGGHSFVCDGYSSDGKFHINWGWGGLSDGYFALSALNPGSQGAGSSEGGYNMLQKAVIGFRPTPAGTPQKTSGHIMGWGNFSRNGNGTFSIYAIGNHWPENVAVYADVEVVDENGTSQFFKGIGGPYTFEPYNPATGKYDFKANIVITTEVKDLKPGVYTVHPAYHTDDLPPRRLPMGSTSQPRLYVAVDATGRQVYSATRPTGLYNLALSSVSAADGSHFKADVNGGVRVEVTNNSLEKYQGEVSAQIFRGNGTLVTTTPLRATLSIEPGGHGVLTSDNLTLTEGNYFIQVYDDADALIGDGRRSFTVYPPNTFDIAQTGIRADGTIYAGAPLRLIADIFNFGNTAFSGNLRFTVLDCAGKVVASATTQADIPASATVELKSPDFDNTLPTGTYDMVMCYFPDGTSATAMTGSLTKLQIATPPALTFNAITVPRLPEGMNPASGVEYDYNLIFNYNDLSSPLNESLTVRVADLSGSEVATLTKDVAYDAGHHTITIEMPMTLDAGEYTVSASYACGLGVTGSPARLTVDESPELELISAAVASGEDFASPTFGMDIVIANNGDKAYSGPLHYRFDNADVISTMPAEIPAADRITVNAEFPVDALSNGAHRLYVADSYLTVINPQGAEFTVNKPASITATATDGVAVSAADGTITVEGAPAGTVIIVSDTRGSQAASTVSLGTTMRIPAPCRGVWIVTVGNRAFKVVAM